MTFAFVWQPPPLPSPSPSKFSAVKAEIFAKKLGMLLRVVFLLWLRFLTAAKGKGKGGAVQ